MQKTCRLHPTGLYPNTSFGRETKYSALKLKPSHTQPTPRTFATNPFIASLEQRRRMHVVLGAAPLPVLGSVRRTTVHAWFLLPDRGQRPDHSNRVSQRNVQSRQRPDFFQRLQKLLDGHELWSI